MELDCPYCHSLDSKIIRRNPKVICCNSCGLYRLSSRMSYEQQKEYLKNLTISSHISSDFLETSILKRFFPALFDGGKILDVGCGEGSFVYTLKKMGVEAIGLEPMKQAGTEQKAELNIYQGFFNREDIPAEILHQKFDLISFRESIYYMNDLGMTFQLLGAILRPNGGLYLKMHVASSFYYLGKKDLTVRYGKCVQFMPTRKALVSILGKEGYKILKVFWYSCNVLHALGLPHSNLPAKVVNRVLEKIFAWTEMLPSCYYCTKRVKNGIK